MVVRLTNKDVVAQVVSSKIKGDFVLAAAYAHELPRFGLKVGLTNYAACYCTGLLLARRLLQKLKLDKKYEGVKEANGEKFLSEVPKHGMRPFKAYLDVGLARTTTGARVFGAMKGAVDGGIYVPHSETRFPGYDRESKKYNAATHRERILGGHVSKYMKYLQENDEESYKKQFSVFIKEGVKAADLEALYKKVHAAIRADPSQKKKETKAQAGKPKRYNKTKLNTHDRRVRREARNAKVLKASKK